MFARFASFRLPEREENDNTLTQVLELKHGWLVYVKRNLGGGLAFAPKENAEDINIGDEMEH